MYIQHAVTLSLVGFMPTQPLNPAGILPALETCCLVYMFRHVHVTCCHSVDSGVQAHTIIETCCYPACIAIMLLGVHVPPCTFSCHSVTDGLETHTAIQPCWFFACIAIMMNMSRHVTCCHSVDSGMQAHMTIETCCYPACIIRVSVA